MGDFEGSWLIPSIIISTILSSAVSWCTTPSLRCGSALVYAAATAAALSDWTLRGMLIRAGFNRPLLSSPTAVSFSGSHDVGAWMPSLDLATANRLLKPVVRSKRTGGTSGEDVTIFGTIPR